MTARWLLLLMLAWPALSSAAPIDTAKAHFQSGSARYNAQDWDGAIAEYQAAYDALPLPAFLFNLGQAYRMKGDRARSLIFYDRFLATNPDSGAADEAHAMRDKLAAELREAGKAQLKPAANPEPTVVATPLVVTRPTPVYRRWWLWTAVGGAVVLAVGLGVGLTVGSRSVDPVGNMGELHP